MLICKNCGEYWVDFGKQWNGGNGYMYYKCSNCGSKKKPIDDGIFFKSKKIFEYKNNSEYENILIVGDLHLPFSNKDYLDFCTDVYDKYNCDHVIFIGDLIDNHFSSFHATDPDGYGAGNELDYAIKELKKWSKVFPHADVCLGNHDTLILRQMYSNGVSKRWVKDFGEVLGVNWDFKPSFEYNNCLFRHGENMKAAPKSGSEMMNVIQGHFHSEAYIHWNVGRGNKVFGMQVPCGVDRGSYAMAYAKEFPKQVIGCGVLLEYGRLPIIEMCDL